MRVFFDLADFWLIFRFFERIDVCPFVSRKLNKLRGPFFINLDNFFPSILIAKNIPPGVKVRGLQRPRNAVRAQDFKFFASSHVPCAQMVRARGSMVLYFGSAKVPQLIVPTCQFLNDPTVLHPRPLGRPTPKKISPHFPQILTGRGQFFLYMGTPKAHQGK